LNVNVSVCFGYILVHIHCLPFWLEKFVSELKPRLFKTNKRKVLREQRLLAFSEIGMEFPVALSERLY